MTAQPDLRPVDWTRSSTRRQHLIALGIPINLDEVRVGDTSSIKQLAPVPINLDKRSTDSVSKTPISRSGTPDGGREAAKAPEMDIDRAKELTSLSEGEPFHTASRMEESLNLLPDPQTNLPSSLFLHYETLPERWTCSHAKRPPC